MDLKPYSYHTFMFPFIWDQDGQIDREYFEKIFQDEDSMWEKIKWFEDEQHDQKNQFNWNKTELITDEDYRLNYNKYQYFHTSVLDAVYGLHEKKNPRISKKEADNNAVVHNFSLKPEMLRNQATYTIQKDTHTFVLKMNGIHLKVFNTGVAVMIFEMENYDHRSIEQVKLINEYGRRIAAPFLPDESNYYLCADCITVQIGDRVVFTDFRKTLRSLHNVEEIKKKIQLTYVASFIKDLIVLRKNVCEEPWYVITSNNRKIENTNQSEGVIEFCIQPIIDDRMFVCCLVRDDSFVKKIREGESITAEKEPDQEQSRILHKIYQEMRPKGYAYQLDSGIADMLYSFAFIDPTYTSCQNDQMTQKLLEKHVYARWIKWGTIHAVTHHSMICLTGEADDVDATVINPFLTQYVQMAILVLVQRASIISFDQKSADLTRGIEKRGKTIKREKILEFLNLQEAYVSFQNQLLFFEVTAQEQGIEIYDMLSESLYVEKEKERLDQELQNLYEATVVNQDIVFNRGASVFAGVALLIAVVDIVITPTQVGIITSFFMPGLWLMVLLGINSLILKKQMKRLK